MPHHAALTQLTSNWVPNNYVEEKNHVLHYNDSSPNYDKLARKNSENSLETQEMNNFTLAT